MASSLLSPPVAWASNFGAQNFFTTQYAHILCLFRKCHVSGTQTSEGCSCTLKHLLALTLTIFIHRPDLTARQAASMQCSAKESVSDEDIEEAAYFSKYAFAAYGYMLYIWSKPQFKCAPRTRQIYCVQLIILP